MGMDARAEAHGPWALTPFATWKGGPGPDPSAALTAPRPRRAPGPRGRPTSRTRRHRAVPTHPP